MIMHSFQNRISLITHEMLRRWVQLALVLLICVLALGVLLCSLLSIHFNVQRGECQSRLRYLGLALSGYYENYHYYPYGIIQNDNLLPNECLSWVVDTVPYFQGGPSPIANIHRDEAWNALVNREIARVSFLRILVCPSAQDRELDHPGLTTYVGMAGVGLNAASLDNKDSRCGIFGYFRRTRNEEIADGLSFTIIVPESGIDIGPWIAGGTSTIRGLDNNAIPYLGHNHQFCGLHPGGGNMLFADGTVQFISNSINPKLYEALCTAHGGEPISLGKAGREKMSGTNGMDFSCNREPSNEIGQPAAAR